ncbi:CaiB/BaiF CoA transferase family protein [Candidatus Binatus sp.]|jgi:crotonobetainyl-CoA:carnitine CoA-transferase CaiB-like acyl-CoA transferase|uniref:CaiB/BaiF CoA transferase family protein n=1 Tax=Candidatus Binatus sp. TaxID=2811406 RepID=UPI003F97BCC5
MGKSLDGINIVEFASHLGAAYATMLLAENGARAIKVEPPGGSRERGTPHFHVLNRSKRALELDLDDRASQPRIADLVRWADIVVTGFTPARLKQLSVDADAIRRINPRAIALGVPALGSRGPDADFDANDDLVAARGGITGSQWASSGNPVALVFPAASYSAGVMAATAAVAAIVARGADRAGDAVEVSILAGAFSLQTGSILSSEAMTTLYQGPLNPLGPIPVYRLFEAADGKYLFAACGNSTFWGKFAIAIDRPDLVADQRFEDAPWGIAPWFWEPLKDIIEPIIRTRTRDEWLGILREYDVPCAPVMTRHDFIDHPQTRALGMRAEIDDPALGRMIQMGLPVFLSDTPGEITGPAPQAGDDRAALQWLAEPARDPSPEKDLRPAERSALDGVIVLDFASYIAGSYGPMLLAQLGATVIKIESLEGDSFRHFGFGFLGWNQGKRGISLNLATAQGREIIHGLADQADIVVENLRPGRMRKFGFDYESLAARNPRIIYMSLNGFGNRGPEHNQPGFDPLLQARSGVMAAQGGHHGHPVYLTCAICDYGAAMLSAFGCVLALRARQRTGRGQLCETSLLQAAMAFQAGEFAFYPGRPDMENGGTEYRGRSALSRAYSCRDGKWLFISLTDESQWNALRTILPGLPNADWDAAAAQPSEGALAAALADQFARLDRDDALAALKKSAIPATRVNHIGELFDDPQVLANDLIAELSHSQWGRVKQTGMLTKFAAAPAAIDRAAPLLGEHTDEILREYLGYPAEKIAALRAAGVVK